MIRQSLIFKNKDFPYIWKTVYNWLLLSHILGQTRFVFHKKQITDKNILIVYCADDLWSFHLIHRLSCLVFLLLLLFFLMANSWLLWTLQASLRNKTTHPWCAIYHVLSSKCLEIPLKDACCKSEERADNRVSDLIIWGWREPDFWWVGEGYILRRSDQMCSSHDKARITKPLLPEKSWRNNLARTWFT